MFLKYNADEKNESSKKSAAITALPQNSTSTTKEAVTLKSPLLVTSKSISADNDTVLLKFSAQINVPLNENIDICFFIKRYSFSSSPINIGSSYSFAAFGDTPKVKSFFMQAVDTDLSFERYTYAIEASSNCFKSLPMDFIIINPNIIIISGNQF